MNEPEKRNNTDFVQVYQKKDLPNKETSRFDDQKRKESRYVEKSSDDVHMGKIHLNRNIMWQWSKTKLIQATFRSSRSIPYLSFSRKITCVSYQFFYSTNKTHGLQHHCFHEQSNLYRIFGLWKMSRKIRVIFLVQIRVQLLAITWT